MAVPTATLRDFPPLSDYSPSPSASRARAAAHPLATAPAQPGKLRCEVYSRTMLLRSLFAMPQQASRTARIEARIAPDALRIVRRAAELQGRSVSDFVVSAAREAARRAIDEAQVIRLSVEDQRRFVELLLNPPALAPALKRAKKAHSRLIASSR